MRKINLLFLMLLLPVCLFSQGYQNEYYTIDPNWAISSVVTTTTLAPILKEHETVGAWKVRGNLDINKNGKKEIVILMDPTGAVTMVRPDDLCYKVFWLEDDGSGNYELLWSYTFPIQGDYSYGDVTVGDVDGDGFDEIWVAIPQSASTEDPNPPRLFCFEYDGTKMPDEPTLTWNLGLRDYMTFCPTRVIIDDMDNDGMQEIIISSRRDDYTGTGLGRTIMISRYYGDIYPGASDFLFVVDYLDTNDYLKGGAIYDISVTDFDGNGVKELWVWTWDMLTLNIFQWNGSTYEHTTYIKQAKSIHGDITSFEGACFYDLNGDGKMEGYLVGATGATSGLYFGRIYYIQSVDDIRNLTGNHFVQVGYNTGGDPRGGTVGDFNNNGLPELVFVDRPRRKLMCMEYKGSGSYADSTSYTWTEVFIDRTPSRPTGVTTGPHNGDYWFVTAGAKDANGLTELLLPNLNVYDATIPSVLIIKAKKTISVKKEAELPEAYNLSQNYPNPFNPSTNIEFSIPKASHISLKIYNVLGQEVSTLVNETKEAGSYIATFNANNLPSGIYYYTIKAGNYIASKKMMLIK